MKRMSVDVYSAATNRAVVRMPGRCFPGIVVQGDTLSGLAQRAGVLSELARTHENARIRDEAEGLLNEIGKLINHYERVLKRHEMPLPYSSSMRSKARGRK